ncbi:MAG: dienelactone hydrolase family protein [Candidatus Nanohaloarchaea archaeon]|nr:dienelactone hydrolase family protein [Candidatus Nanohaloarchaea archaeon]
MADIHADGPLLEEDVGAPEKAVILLHGRGAAAESILELGRDVADDALLLAPEAEQRQWYPEPFMQPRQENQPWLDAALDRVAAVIEEAGDRGFDTDMIHLIGFSQGACLAAEYTAAAPGRYGSVSVLSGGLIGEEVDAFDGDLERTPVFIGCSDQDPYIPLDRVEATADVFQQLNADVDLRIYEGMGHTVNDDERSAIGEHLG